jgi:hypothetical protein
MQIRATENPEEFGKCGCGRSPTGKCIGLHSLSEDEWQGGKTQILANIAMGRGHPGFETSDGDENELV